MSRCAVLRTRLSQKMQFLCRLWWFLFVLFPTLTHSLKNVTLQIEPRVVRRGGDVTLTCTYDLEDDTLYTVKWYRGKHEFFRYTPEMHPSFKVFPFGNIKIDLQQSDAHRVIIREVDFALSGRFECEVSSDAPAFYVVSAQDTMTVVVFPESPPKVITSKSSYDVGDTLIANCTSGPSKPETTLTFTLNNMVVCKHCETKRHASGDLVWSEKSLVLLLSQSYFSSGHLKLRCSAQITYLYQADTDVILFDGRGPLSEAMLQSVASFCFPSRIIIATTLIFLWGSTICRL